MPTPSRVTVARALHAVFGESARVPEGWDAGLLPEDAALANALLGLCLRRWGSLQAWCRPLLKDPGRGLPLGSQVALAVGLAQLAWLPGVSDHAAVNEAVELAGTRDLGFPPHRGLVNALLRRAAGLRPTLAAALDAAGPGVDRTPFADRLLAEALAPWGSAETDRETLWRRLQTPPRPWFRALRPEPPPPGLNPAGEVPGALTLDPEAPFPRTWLAEGAGMVQDLSSQALLDFTWDGPPPPRILDVCAAPGGKTTALALRFPQARITALEKRAVRARRLQENLKLRRIHAEVVVAEAGHWLSRATSLFELILLDAPCTGSGTLQKHPELTWLGDEADIRRQARVQEQLLEAALARLAPGGVLIYAVCSWFPEEAAAHLARLREIRPDLRPAPIWPAHLGIGPDPGAWFRPDPRTWAGEGFQAFALRR